MLRLGYTTTQPLDAARVFFLYPDGITRLRIRGQRLIGDWDVTLTDIHHPATVGHFRTSHPQSPDYPRNEGADLADYRTYAHRAIIAWLLEQTRAAGLRLLSWEPDPPPLLDDPRPYACGGWAVLGNAEFNPSPDAVYADLKSIDEILTDGPVTVRETIDWERR